MGLSASGIVLWIRVVGLSAAAMFPLQLVSRQAGNWHLQLKFASHVNSTGHLRLGAVHRTAGVFSTSSRSIRLFVCSSFQMKIVDSGCRTQAVILSTTLAIRRVFCNKRIQLSLLVSSTGSVESRPDSLW